MWCLPSRGKCHLSLTEFWTHQRHARRYFPSAINHILTHCALDTMEKIHRIHSWKENHHAYIDILLKFIPLSKELQHATISSYNGSEPIRRRDNSWATDDLVERHIKCTIMQGMFGIHFRQRKYLKLYAESLKFVLRYPISNQWALLQVMAWHWTDGNPLPKPMTSHSSNAYTRHQAWMRLWYGTYKSYKRFICFKVKRLLR